MEKREPALKERHIATPQNNIIAQMQRVEEYMEALKQRCLKESMPRRAAIKKYLSLKEDYTWFNKKLTMLEKIMGLNEEEIIRLSSNRLDSLQHYNQFFLE